MSKKHKQIAGSACWRFNLVVSTLMCLILCSFINIVSVEAFNLEFRNPIVKKGTKGTYFGYSVAQHIDSNHKQWLLVGAPLGNNEQPNTNRSGALYKCPITRRFDDCVQVVTDGRRPQNLDNFYDDIEEDKTLMPPGQDEIKNGQWLGVTVKSQLPSAGGKVMVCAHRYIKSPKLSEKHHGLGLCHLLNGALEWEEALEPCEGKPMQQEHLEYAYCQAGTSLAFMNDGTALMGAPGPHTWRGTIFAKMTVGEFLNRDKNFYSSPLNHRSDPIDKYSYLGMSVTGGRFFNKNKVTYVSGAPRANLTGQVYLIEKDPPRNEMIIRLILKGEQVASNYGYELHAADVNGDGYDDLFVSAPFFFNNTQGGAVYIYYNLRHCLANYTCEPDVVLYGKEESRFGFAVTSLGDINKDGYNDIAIGAPYESYEARSHIGGTGAVYIYLGSKDYLKKKEAQKIVIPGHTTIGYSLSGGVDMDSNSYPDLLVGVYNEDEVILFKTRSIVHIEIEVQDSEMRNIDVNKKGCTAEPKSPHTCFSFNICIRTNERIVRTLFLSSELGADLGKTKGQYIRTKFSATSDNNTLTKHFSMLNSPTCHNYTVYIKDGIRDILSPIEFTVKYDLKNDIDSPILNQTSMKHFKATFLKDCGVNEVCESDLKISAGLSMEMKESSQNLYALDLGTIEELNVQVNVSNDGESAYEAQLFIIHPDSLSYIALNDKMSDIKCIYHNETWIACNLGNPFGKNKSARLGLRFENRNNMKNEDFLEFKAFVNTTSNTTTNETAASFKVAVKITPNIKIDNFGTSSVHYGGIPKGESAINYFDEIGSRVLHIYQVTNEGKWSANKLDALIDWPIQIYSAANVGKWLLYLEELPTFEIDGIFKNCEITSGHIANELNYTSRPNQSENSAPENFMVPLSSFTSVPPPFNTRKTRSIDEVQDVEEDIIPARLTVGSGESTKDFYTFDCLTGTAKCATIKCSLPSLSKHTGATIRVISRLWNSTLIEDFNEKPAVKIISRMRINAAEAQLKHSTAEVITSAYSTRTTPEKYVPWWIIIVAIIGGILLFALAVWILYCFGFFKRKQFQQNTTYTAQHNKQSAEEGQGLLSNSKNTS